MALCLRRIVHAGVDLADERVPTTPNQIKQLEDAHAILDAYLWLAVRFGEKVRFSVNRRKTWNIEGDSFSSLWG